MIIAIKLITREPLLMSSARRILYSLDVSNAALLLYKLPGNNSNIATPLHQNSLNLHVVGYFVEEYQM